MSSNANTAVNFYSSGQESVVCPSSSQLKQNVLGRVLAWWTGLLHLLQVGVWSLCFRRTIYLLKCKKNNNNNKTNKETNQKNKTKTKTKHKKKQRPGLDISTPKHEFRWRFRAWSQICCEANSWDYANELRLVSFFFRHFSFKICSQVDPWLAFPSSWFNRSYAFKKKKKKECQRNG